MSNDILLLIRIAVHILHRNAFHAVGAVFTNNSEQVSIIQVKEFNTYITIKGLL